MRPTRSNNLSARASICLLLAVAGPAFAYETFPGDAKWGSDMVGTGAVVTWSLMLDGTGTSTEFQNKGYWGGSSDLNRIYYSLQGYATGDFGPGPGGAYDPGHAYTTGQSIFTTALDKAFDTWEAVANVTFLQTADNGQPLGHTGTPTGGNIRIGAFSLAGATGGSPYTNSGAWAFEPTNGTSAFSADITGDNMTSLFGDLTLNSAGFFFSSEYNDARPFAPNEIQNILTHEIGHSLGLIHTSDPAAIMNPSRDVTNLALGQDDIDGMQYLYGAPVPEPSSAMLAAVGLAAGLRRRRGRTSAEG